MRQILPNRGKGPCDDPFPDPRPRLCNRIWFWDARSWGSLNDLWRNVVINPFRLQREHAQAIAYAQTAIAKFAASRAECINLTAENRRLSAALVRAEAELSALRKLKALVRDPETGRFVRVSIDAGL